MKRFIIFIFAALISTSAIVAQSSGREVLARQAEQYITQFQLDNEEAQQFRSIYFAYVKEMRSVQQQYAHEQPAPEQVLTDDEIEERILDNFAMSRSILNLREQYYHKFRQILSPSQINAIFEGEKARRAQLKK